MRVSIVIPSFERPKLLKVLLESIKQQTYKDFEVIIVDDCSKDYEDIKSVVNDYKSFFNVTLLQNEKRSGAPVSRNKGIHRAQGDLIALVDDDDEWFPQKLEKQVEMFDQNGSQVGIVYTWTKVVDPERNVLREEKGEIEGIAESEILDSCFIPSPSVMVRKKALIEAGLFDETFPSCQDWDMWTRVIFQGYEVKVCKDFLTYYYKHSGPTIGTSPNAKKGFIKFYQKHFIKLMLYGKLRHLVRLVRLKLAI